MDNLSLWCMSSTKQEISVNDANNKLIGGDLTLINQFINIKNTETLIIPDRKTLILDNKSNINNKGKINNYGSINNHNSILNYDSFNNYGLIKNNYIISNDFNYKQYGKILNDGKINNKRIINNNGTNPY